MRAVYLHQLLDSLKSLRFQISLLLLLILFGLNGLVYSWKHERLVENYATLRANVADAYEASRTLSDVLNRWYHLLYPRTQTEFIAEGGANWFDNSAYIRAESGSAVVYGRHVGGFNNWMQRYEILDWSFLVRYVLSFLCIVLAYNAISGELESGTLRLALANPLSRGRWLAGAFLAHLTTLMAALTVGSLVSLAILSLSGALSLNAEVIRGYVLFLLGAALYISLFLLLSMGISSLLRSSAASLVSLVLLWAVLIVVVPQTSYVIAMRSVEPVGAWREKPAELIEQVVDRLEADGILPRGRDLGQVDDYALERRYTQAFEDIEGEHAALVRSQYRQIVRQYEVGRTVNLLSPGMAFQYALESVLGTGLQRYEDLLAQSWRYRSHLRDFVRVRDAADPDSPHVLYLVGYVSDRELEPADIPRFAPPARRLAPRVDAGAAQITVLLLEAALAFFFAQWAFYRMDLIEG